MKHKSEVFKIFKRWKAMVENEISLKVKCLRLDNGGEFKLREFKKFYGLNDSFREDNSRYTATKWEC